MFVQFKILSNFSLDFLCNPGLCTNALLYFQIFKDFSNLLKIIFILLFLSGMFYKCHMG